MSKYWKGEEGKKKGIKKEGGEQRGGRAGGETG